MDLKQYVSEVEDWPKPGVNFKDITTIMDNGEAYGYATDQIVEYAKLRDVDIIVGPEARGFIIRMSSGIFNGHWFCTSA